jgi:hypothetical protein
LKTESKVRLAQPSDEPELLHLFRLMHAEGGMRPLDIECVRETFARAFGRQGGILAVIGASGHIRAMQYLLITRWYYTRENHLEELWNWVHPDHRNSDYSKLLIDHAKSCSDQLSASMGVKVPLIMGVLTNNRMAAKVRLYRKFFGIPVGAYFVHNATWVAKQEPAEEDFWRLPKLSRLLYRTTSAKPAKQRAVNGV